MDRTADGSGNPDAPRTPHEGLGTFVALLIGFVGVHFFLPQYVDNAMKSRQEEVGGLSKDMTEGEMVTIDEDVFGDDGLDVFKAPDLKLLSSLGYGGDLDAQIKLAKHFGKIGDENRAFQWNFRAAMQGHAVSMIETGQRYYYGRGTRKSLMRAICWYRLAGEFGEAIGTQMADSASLRLSETETRQIGNQVKSIGVRIRRNIGDESRDEEKESSVTARR